MKKKKQIWPARNLPGLIGPGTLHQYYSASPLALAKMADILADDIFKRIFFNENGIITIQISLKFVLQNPIDNKPEEVQVIAWRRTGDKPLPGPMMTQFAEVYMRH